MRSRYCTAERWSRSIEPCIACLTCGPPSSAAGRRSDGGRPCPPSGRSTSPCRPGRSRRSAPTAPPRCSCPPGAGCRRRAPFGSPSSRRTHASCRSACGRGRICCARKLPKGAIPGSCRLLRCRLLAGVRERRFAHPRTVFPCLDARAQALAIAWTIARDDALEFVPIDGPVIPVLALFVPAQPGVGQRDAEDLRLLAGGVDELLPQLVVRDPLDAPAHRLRRVRRLVVGRPEHHQARPPPAVHRVLHHRFLRIGAVSHHRQQGLEALALMEAFLTADANHRACIRRERATANRHLVHDRRAVHEPADRPHIGPGQRRVVEDRAVFRAATVQCVDHLVARGAERLSGGVEVQAVTGLVLHLGEQDGLALERRRAADPVAFGQHADDLRMRVLADLPQQRLAVVLGHPVLSLDEVAGVDARIESLLQLHLFGRSHGLDVVAVLRVHRLRVHRLAFHFGRWSTTRRALPTSVRSIESGTRTTTFVETPTSVLMRWLTQRAISPRSASSVAAAACGCNSQRTSTASSGPSRVTTIWYCPDSFACCNTISSIWVGNMLTPRMISMSSERPTILPMRRNERAVGGKSRVKSRVR